MPDKTALLRSIWCDSCRAPSRLSACLARRFGVAESRLYPRSTDQEVLDFVTRWPEVRYVAFDRPRFSSWLAASLKEIGVLSLVYTVNDPLEIEQFIARGAWGFYTDFFPPAK